MLRLILLPAFLLSSIGSSLAQQPDIRVQVQRVNLIVTVTDKKGRFVTDLEQGRFEITEDGVRQTITNFDRPTDLPLQMALLLDTSYSVRTRLEFQKEAAVQFVFGVMQPKDLALVVEFDRGVSLLHDFTSRPGDIAREIRALKDAGGGTALLDAIYKVTLDKMSQSSGDARKILVLVSDGEDRDSRIDREEALRILHGSNVVVYSIGTNLLGADQRRKGKKMLEKLSQETGGRSFFPYSSDRLEEAFTQLNDELRSQYLLVYEPTNKSRDGRFRKIRVKLKDKGGLRIRHRRGYFSQGPLASN